MSSSTLSREATSTSTSTVSTMLAVGSVLSALGCVAFMTQNGAEPRESYATALNTATGTIATLGSVTLLLTLARWRSTLPAWAQLSAAGNLVFVSAAAWFQGTGIRAISDHTSNEEFKRLMFEAPWLLVMTVPAMVLGLVGFVALGVAGWRQRSLPRTASALLILGGVASALPVYPPGLLIVSVALFIASRSMARS